MYALPHLRSDDVGAGKVGDDGHDHVAVRHAAVDFELLELDAGVVRHALHDGARHERVRLKGGARDVSGGRVRREACIYALRNT